MCNFFMMAISGADVATLAIRNFPVFGLCRPADYEPSGISYQPRICCLIVVGFRRPEDRSVKGLCFITCVRAPIHPCTLAVVSSSLRSSVTDANRHPTFTSDTFGPLQLFQGCTELEMGCCPFVY